MPNEKHVWPDELMIRDTTLHDDLGGLGQRIYTTAGQGYEKRRYVRAELVQAWLRKFNDALTNEAYHELANIVGDP